MAKNPRRAAGIARRGLTALLAWCLIGIRAAAGALVSGIPSGVRLRLIARSRRTRRLRQAAEADFRARLAQAVAPIPGARIALTVVEDLAVRPRRFEPRIFPYGAPEHEPYALRATLYVSVYAVTDAAPDEVLAALRNAGDVRPNRPSAAYGNGWILDCDRPDQPLPDHHPHSAADPLRPVHHTLVQDPPATSVTALRRATGTILRARAQVTYLTLPRWPLLSRLTPAGRRARHVSIDVAQAGREE
ncbi:hypothetical protein [Actinacidiphila acididurans]|uniref:Uncharacterized protein n=1 Tax=Actinacidiphila acididurans TaxID=2784346 RepID=A0ABS2TMR0_9ACTN|nr:hypothetical protein [Actinacidiphila acididurans]MBM9504630.1 hypothetical protein [Actinacidiphila acididurans]